MLPEDIPESEKDEDAPDDWHAQGALDRLLTLLEDIFEWTSNHDAGSDEKDAELERRRRQRKLQSIEAVAYLEGHFPRTEQTISLHELLHVAGACFLSILSIYAVCVRLFTSVLSTIVCLSTIV